MRRIEGVAFWFLASHLFLRQPKKLWRSIEAGMAKILIDPFVPDNPSRDNYLAGKNSTQGGDR